MPGSSNPPEPSSSADPHHPGAAGGEAGRSAVQQRLNGLVQRCTRGDEAAFAELHDLTCDRVHGVVLRVLRDPSQSEEVTQEVYLEAWRTASRHDPERGSVTAWLVTMAHRRAVDRVRASEASSRRDEAYGRTHVDVDHDATAEDATTALEAARVRRAMACLTPAQREALELAYFSGYTHTQVAQVLGLPVGTAKTRIRDGLIRLRDEMGVPA